MSILKDIASYLSQKVVVWLLLFSPVFLAGCLPSTSELQEFRSNAKPSPTDALVMQEQLLCLVGARIGKNPPPDETRIPGWRIEAIRTLCHIDKSFQYSKEIPELHAELKSFLQDEYEKPKAQTNTQAIRSWCIHCLASMDDQGIVRYLVQVLEENPLSNDADFMVCLAAFDALYPHMKNLRSDPSLRRRMLAQLATMSSELANWSGTQAQRKRVNTALECFEQNLTGYEAVVDLLSQQLRVSADWKAVARILKWNYQRLAIGEHLKTIETRRLFKDNVDLLLDLIWMREAGIYDGSRVILAGFAPLEFLLALATRIADEKSMSEEDMVHFVTLLSRTETAQAKGDTIPGFQESQWDDFELLRERSLDGLFKMLPRASSRTREFVFVHLFKHDPLALAPRLASLKSSSWCQASDDCLQYIRYAGIVRQCEAIKQVPELRNKVTKALAAQIRHPSIKVRKQVVANLLKDEPDILEISCASVFTDISKEPKESAAYLLDVFLTCLKHNKKEGHERFAPLQYAIRRFELDTNRKIAKFLSSRDCDVFVRMMCDEFDRQKSRVEKIDVCQTELLGDTLRACQSTLRPESIQRGVIVFKALLLSSDEETALLCARFLAELGIEIPQNVLVHSPSIRAIAELQQL